MRKIRKLSLFGILVLVTGLLFLIGISFTPAQVQAKGKPDKPPGNGEPEATWAVRIPTKTEATSQNLMFYGVENGYYEDNDPNIVVSVKKNSPGTWRRYFNFVYDFDFTITNEKVGEGIPPANQVGFQSVGGLYEHEYPDDDKPYCQFLLSTQSDDCMANFLNNEHPYSGVETGEQDYQYFWCRIHVFDKDIEAMTPGEVYVFGSGPDAGEPGDFLRMVARYRQDCYPEPLYHDVEIYRNINYWRAISPEYDNPLNIEIKRLATDEYDITCDGVWRFRVYPYDAHGTSGKPGFLKVKERYCTTEKNKIKWYCPMEAKGNFDFYIDFIKNPQSSPPTEKPVAPSNLIADASACNQIDLSWTDNSDNETGFEIERIDDSSEFTVGEGVTSYSDTGVSENTTYSYRVTAYNDTGDSDYSNTASATTPACGGTEPPDAPSDLTANARGKAKIALNWTDNSTNEYGFIIYRGSEQIASVGPDITSYVDKGLVSKTTYYYEVCAYNEHGEGNYSNIDSATAK